MAVAVFEIAAASPSVGVPVHGSDGVDIVYHDVFDAGGHAVGAHGGRTAQVGVGAPSGTVTGPGINHLVQYQNVIAATLKFINTD